MPELFDQLATLVIGGRWDDDFDVDVLIAAFDAFAAETKSTRAARGAGGNLHGQLRSFHSGHVDLRAEGRFGDGDRNLQVDVVLLAAEEGMRLDFDFEEEIAAAWALTLDSQRLTFFDAGGDFEFDVLAVDVDAHLSALHGDEKRNAELVRFGRRSGTTTASGLAAFASEGIAGRAAEELAEDVLGLAWVDMNAAGSAPGEAGLSAAAHVLRAGEAELIVLAAFLLVAENVVGVLDFLELRLGLFVAGIAVGMKLPRESAMGLLDFVVRRRFGDAQHFVVIASHESVWD